MGLLEPHWDARSERISNGGALYIGKYDANVVV